MWIVIVLVVVLALIAMFVIGMYNNLVTLKMRVKKKNIYY